jgi:hypothetical protein
MFGNIQRLWFEDVEKLLPECVDGRTSRVMRLIRSTMSLLIQLPFLARFFACGRFARRVTAGIWQESLRQIRIQQAHDSFPYLPH